MFYRICFVLSFPYLPEDSQFWMQYVKVSCGINFFKVRFLATLASRGRIETLVKNRDSLVNQFVKPVMTLFILVTV